MSTYQKIKEGLKEAMKAQNRTHTTWLRNGITIAQAIQKEEKAPQMTDEIMECGFRKHVKQLQKALKKLPEGELYNEYENEIFFCEGFLPKSTPEISLDDQVEIVQAAIRFTKATTLRDKGKVIGYVMKNTPGLDGKTINNIVTKELTLKESDL